MYLRCHTNIKKIKIKKTSTIWKNIPRYTNKAFVLVILLTLPLKICAKYCLYYISNCYLVTNIRTINFCEVAFRHLLVVHKTSTKYIQYKPSWACTSTTVGPFFSSWYPDNTRWISRYNWMIDWSGINLLTQ